MKNNPNAKPKVENHNIGITSPATNVEKSICMKAWPEAAVPRILGKQSRAASEITGITAAIPIL